MSSSHIIYEGKAKIVKIIGDTAEMMFKDTLTAFNGRKKASFDGKGAINAEISYILFSCLEKHGIKTHLISRKDERTLIVRRLDMIPLEVVVRNYVAGSLKKRVQLKEKTKLPFPIVELYYKNDELGDPLINHYHARLYGIKEDILKEIEKKALKVNEVLTEVLDNVGIILADFKLEFGYDIEGTIVLGDEISPDTCRFSDKKTLKSLDKDVFRFDLGDVKDAYLKALERIRNVEI